MNTFLFIKENHISAPPKAAPLVYKILEKHCRPPQMLEMGHWSPYEASLGQEILNSHLFYDPRALCSVLVERVFLVITGILETSKIKLGILYL